MTTSAAVTVNGTATMSAAVTVNGTATMSAAVTVNGTATMSAAVTVNGTATMSAAVTMSGIEADEIEQLNPREWSDRQPFVEGQRHTPGRHRPVDRPEATGPPEAGNQPDATGQPEATNPREAADQPDAMSPLEATSQPKARSEPDTTSQLEGTGRARTAAGDRPISACLWLESDRFVGSRQPPGWNHAASSWSSLL
ncbi:hypothetical protein [Thermoactinospora rubra]|uniref:hypothetical protein n=1 Tax=Thermoactinospora rubra TaxID=1088767 RepID=UPI001301B6FF|nr:hypothetical protein [Thermoactinospora rubra]